ncbi:hypothetical protein GCM10022254_23320 [Actinomadura meridiana]|uniref:DUF397 domain-containing protein n=1 Tax=Actinomadura meridiana TaxID=559626 RepID=A0ABP8BXP4_9ACTN
MEVAELFLAIAVRDSKDPDGPKLAFERAAFADLVTGIQTGRYDR